MSHSRGGQTLVAAADELTGTCRGVLDLLEREE
jgi:hypothetical protein